MFARLQCSYKKHVCNCEANHYKSPIDELVTDALKMDSVLHVVCEQDQQVGQVQLAQQVKPNPVNTFLEPFTPKHVPQVKQGVIHDE